MDQTLEEKEVQTATATTSLLEITGGLAEGDEIVVAMEQSGKKAMGTPQPGETNPVPLCRNHRDKIRRVRSKMIKGYRLEAIG